MLTEQSGNLCEPLYRPALLFYEHWLWCLHGKINISKDLVDNK